MGINKLKSRFKDQEDIPKQFKIAIDYLRKSFGGTNVEIVGKELRRTKSTKEYPHGMLGLDLKIENVDFFLNVTLAEDICFYGLIIAEDVVGTLTLKK